MGTPRSELVLVLELEMAPLRFRQCLRGCFRINSTENIAGRKKVVESTVTGAPSTEDRNAVEQICH